MGFELDCIAQQLRARPRFRAVITLERMELGCNARNGRTMTTMRRTQAAILDELTLLTDGNPMWKDALGRYFWEEAKERELVQAEREARLPKGLMGDLGNKLEHR